MQASISESSYLRSLRTKEDVSNYIPIKDIGKGAHGKVKLVRKRQDGKVYALKRLLKTELLSSGLLMRLHAEREALAEFDSEWIVKLYSAFQDGRSVYMLLEFLPGSDLRTLMMREGLLTEETTRFYAAELVLAIEAIHSHDIIHRDIKPENILFDRDGHIKLADFGLSKLFHKNYYSYYHSELAPASTISACEAQNRSLVSIDVPDPAATSDGESIDTRQSKKFLAFSCLGTPTYRPPESLTTDGHSFEFDWWSLGTIMSVSALHDHASRQSRGLVLSPPQALLFMFGILGQTADHLSTEADTSAS